jgi:hypothetical protein
MNQKRDEEVINSTSCAMLCRSWSQQQQQQQQQRRPW